MDNNFIRTIVEEDLQSGKHQAIITRFPPEPNGYLHVGHAKSICLNFGLAQEFNGKCNLRFDDTNPDKETEEYVLSIEENIKWLNFNWDGEVKYASDYFDKLYEFARYFIQANLAYVCDLGPEAMKYYRGSFTEPGKNSPYRERSIAENLDLFTRMQQGEFTDGSKTLRLKIDMAAANINMRDPVIYRIKRAHHIRTKDKWCIYPMYDYTHCISDAIEGITHSCCTLEFEDHRPLYDWIVDHLVKAQLLNCHPRQIEFSRLELNYTVTSKRKLNQLVSDKLVAGFDDPRMPTLAGMRRRGYTPQGIRLFAQRCGIAKSPNLVDLDFLEAAVRDDLENTAPRVMAVLKPIKVILTNFTNDTSSRNAEFHPKCKDLGERLVKLTREIYIEADDFSLNPAKDWQRLAPGKEVRLRHSYIMRCDEVIYAQDGTIKELLCNLDLATLGKNPEGRKVKGVIHWVSAIEAVKVQVRLYDRLFTVAQPDNSVNDFKTYINPDSFSEIEAYIEPSIGEIQPEQHYQFERLGYFVVDRYCDVKKRLIFNKTVSLRSSFQHPSGS